MSAVRKENVNDDVLIVFIRCNIPLNLSRMVDAGTKKALSSIPLLQTRAGPREKELWVQRLKEEYQSLIKVRMKK